MQTIFADTGYWVALLNEKDELHHKAVELSKSIQPAHIVTSDLVMTEVLNDFSKRGSWLRVADISLVKELRQLPNVTIVPQTESLFEEGLKLYDKGPDKAWSQTDCVSFVVMRQQKISKALAYDKHFIQAGFYALLRD